MLVTLSTWATFFQKKAGFPRGLPRRCDVAKSLQRAGSLPHYCSHGTGKGAWAPTSSAGLAVNLWQWAHTCSSLWPVPIPGPWNTSANMMSRGETCQRNGDYTHWWWHRIGRGLAMQQSTCLTLRRQHTVPCSFPSSRTILRWAGALLPTRGRMPSCMPFYRSPTCHPCSGAFTWRGPGWLWLCLSSPTCRGSPAFLPSWPGCHGSSLCVGIYCLRPGDPVPSIPGRPSADGLAAEREGLLALCLPVASRGHHASGSMYPSLRLPLVRYSELVLLSGPRPMACPGPCHAGLSPAAEAGGGGTTLSLPSRQPVLWPPPWTLMAVLFSTASWRVLNTWLHLAVDSRYHPGTWTQCSSPFFWVHLLSRLMVLASGDCPWKQSSCCTHSQFSRNAAASFRIVLVWFCGRALHFLAKLRSPSQPYFEASLPVMSWWPSWAWPVQLCPMFCPSSSRICPPYSPVSSLRPARRLLRDGTLGTGPVSLRLG